MLRTLPIAFAALVAVLFAFGSVRDVETAAIQLDETTEVVA
jgi:hypothetical protein